MKLHRHFILPPLLLVSSLGLASGPTIRVVDESDGHGVVSEIYRADADEHLWRAGQTDGAGVLHLREAGKQGERYVVRNPAYDQVFLECPTKDCVVKVRRTSFVAQYERNGEALASDGEPAAAAVEFRKAAVAAEKTADFTLSNELELKAAASAAKALEVRQPFTAAGENRVAHSAEFSAEIRAFQQEHALKPSGFLSRDTLNVMATMEKSCGARELGHASQ